MTNLDLVALIAVLIAGPALVWSWRNAATNRVARSSTKPALGRASLWLLAANILLVVVFSEVMSHWTQVFLARQGTFFLLALLAGIPLSLVCLLSTKYQPSKGPRVVTALTSFVFFFLWAALAIVALPFS